MQILFDLSKPSKNLTITIWNHKTAQFPFEIYRNLTIHAYKLSELFNKSQHLITEAATENKEELIISTDIPTSKRLVCTMSFIYLMKLITRNPNTNIFIHKM